MEKEIKEYIKANIDEPLIEVLDNLEAELGLSYDDAVKAVRDWMAECPNE